MTEPERCSRKVKRSLFGEFSRTRTGAGEPRSANYSGVACANPEVLRCRIVAQRWPLSIVTRWNIDHRAQGNLLSSEEGSSSRNSKKKKVPVRLLIPCGKSTCTLFFPFHSEEKYILLNVWQKSMRVLRHTNILLVLRRKARQHSRKRYPKVTALPLAVTKHWSTETGDSFRKRQINFTVSRNLFTFSVRRTSLCEWPVYRL